MVANMGKVEGLPAQTADELIYALTPSPAVPAAPSVPVAAAAAPVSSPVSVAKIPFTNQLTPETFLRLKQFECWGGMEIQDILEEALTAFFAGKPEADRELPAKAKEKLRKKLPNLQ